MKEEYVSFGIAKLLKEKGFCERCFVCYEQDGKVFEGFANWNKADIYIAAPTHQMAMAWLREVHNIFIGVDFGADNRGDFLFMADIYDLTNDAIGGRYVPIVESDEYLTKNPKSPEEAIEEALKYVLENLI